MPTCEFWLSDWDVIVCDVDPPPEVGETVELGGYGTVVITRLQRDKHLLASDARIGYICDRVFHKPTRAARAHAAPAGRAGSRASSSAGS
jgi:hypothetical protein